MMISARSCKRLVTRSKRFRTSKARTKLGSQDSRRAQSATMPKSRCFQAKRTNAIETFATSAYFQRKLLKNILMKRWTGYVIYFCDRNFLPLTIHSANKKTSRCQRRAEEVCPCEQEGVRAVQQLHQTAGPATAAPGRLGYIGPVY
jgi:hypothetical protein